MSLLELFVDVDDFCQGFELWASSQQLPEAPRRGPAPSLSPSEIMTIVIHFHQAGYRLDVIFLSEVVVSQMIPAIDIS